MVKKIGTIKNPPHQNPGSAPAERLAQMVRLQKTKRNIEICGISGQTIKSSTTVVVQFRASPIMRGEKFIAVTALDLDK